MYEEQSRFVTAFPFLLSESLIYIYMYKNISFKQEPCAKKLCSSSVMTALSSFSPAPAKKLGNSLQVCTLKLSCLFLYCLIVLSNTTTVLTRIPNFIVNIIRVSLP